MINEMKKVESLIEKWMKVQTDKTNFILETNEEIIKLKNDKNSLERLDAKGRIYKSLLKMFSLVSNIVDDYNELITKYKSVNRILINTERQSPKKLTILDIYSEYNWLTSSGLNKVLNNDKESIYRFEDLYLNLRDLKLEEKRTIDISEFNFDTVIKSVNEHYDINAVKIDELREKTINEHNKSQDQYKKEIEKSASKIKEYISLNELGYLLEKTPKDYPSYTKEISLGELKIEEKEE